MKFVKRIGLFLSLAGLMFGAGSYLTLKAEQFFYPNRYESGRHDLNESVEEANDKYESESGGNEADISARDHVNKSEQVIEAIVEDDPVITADTVYLVEEVNLTDGTVTEKEEPLPVKYVGLNRESLIKELDSYENSPALRDLQRGFESMELTVFSKDRIVVCKYYKSEEEGQGYYLMVTDHFVVVYREDKKTIYLITEILLENLDENLQEEIIKGKYMEDEQSLFNFLESYSS